MVAERRYTITVLSKEPGLWRLLCTEIVPPPVSLPLSDRSSLAIPERKIAALTTAQREALRILNDEGGTCDPMAFAGDAHALQRQRLMELLTGQKVPKGRCGVNALREAFFRLMPPTEESTCRVEELSRFQAWTQDTL